MRGLIENIQYEVLMGASGWDLTNFLKNSTKQIKTWGGLFLTLVGVVGIVWSAFQIISGLMSHGKKQVSYGTNVVLLLISGALSATGLTLVTSIAEGGKQTIQDLGSTIQLFNGIDLSAISTIIQNGLPF